MARAAFTSFSSMTKRPLRDDPPWMRLGPAPDDPAEGDEGEKLWREFSNRVTPLKGKKPEAAPGSKPASVAKPGPKGAKSTVLGPSPNLPRPAGAVGRPPARAHGTSPDVDARTLTKLRRGLVPIEATLDLHGLSESKAYDALLRFLPSRQAKGIRCARIVTGRGLKGDWSVGVLRAAVPRWLNEAPLAPLVLAFSYATPDDGGTGALYVLLRR